MTDSGRTRFLRRRRLRPARGRDRREQGRSPGAHRQPPAPAQLPDDAAQAADRGDQRRAAGLGFVEPLYRDVRFCVPGAKLATAFVRRGLIAEYGASWILPRLVGTSRALDLLPSGRVMLGEEAHRIGLVDHLAEPGELLDDAVAYAEELPMRRP